MLFMQEIQNCAGRDVGLLIWSAKVPPLYDSEACAPADQLPREHDFVIS